MSEFDYPLWKRITGTFTGYLFFVLANILIRLPFSFISFKLTLFGKCLKDSNPLKKDIGSLSEIFQKKGENAEILRKLIIESRIEEIVLIVRGNVIRNLK